MGEIADVLKRFGRSSAATADTYREDPKRGPGAVPGARRGGESNFVNPPPPPPSLDFKVAKNQHRPAKDIRRDDPGPWLPAQIAVSQPTSPSSQQYRRLAFRIRERADSRGARSIVITSAQPGDGKTTTSCNLAIQLARLDQSSRVVLVDLDLRRATLAKAFGITVDVSVDAVLRDEANVHDAICETDVPGLCILALARPAPEPDWLLAQPNLAAMIRDLEDEFDYVIIDTPPVLATSDAQVILRHAATGIFVVRAAVTGVKAVKHALDHLPTNKLLGTIMNVSQKKHLPATYSYYGYDERPADDTSGSDASDASDASDVSDTSDARGTASGADAADVSIDDDTTEISVPVPRSRQGGQTNGQ